MSSLKKPKYIPKPLSLKDFHAKKDQILIWHDKGGLGDVLMQRMMFDDFKSLFPNSELIFACLPEYISAVEDHPCISKVLDSRMINPNDYLACYNTCVSIADRYENNHAPSLEHRSDIWAKFCGIELKNHDMRFRLDPILVKSTRKKLEALTKNSLPIILFSPTSKMATKTLLPWQIKVIVEETKNYNLVGLHKDEIPELTKLGIPGIYNISIKEWMCYLTAADYVISVDSAAFHMAGGLKKPLMGIFTFADGVVYGKHFNFVLVQKHRKNGNWDCGPCFKFAGCPKCKTMLKPCLTEISKEMLTDGIAQLFSKFPLK